MPVIHRGHIEFCERQKPEKLYLLGKSLTDEFPHLERDIRALNPEKILVAARALNLTEEVLILEKDNINKVFEADEVVVSDDDVMRSFVKTHLDSNKVVYDTTFLRWHKMNAVTKISAKSDAKVTKDEFSKKIMSLACSEAKRSSDWWRRVGAVLIKDNKIISVGHNKHAITENTAYIEGEPRSNFDAGKAIADLVIFQHSEAALISEMARNGISTKDTEIYVTTFPCPTCAMFIANAGIKKVFYKEGYSLLDAERILKQEGIELIQVID